MHNQPGFHLAAKTLLDMYDSEQNANSIMVQTVDAAIGYSVL